MARGRGPLFDGVPPTFASRALHLTDAVSILKAANRVPAAGPFVVNVGAADMHGGFADPTWEVLVDDVNASALITDLQVEGGEHGRLFRNYPHRAGIQFALGVPVTAATFPAFLVEHGVPFDFTLFKIDIDHDDCAITDAALRSGFRPALVYMEVLTAVPPPLRFAPSALWIEASKYNDFFGCSLSYADDMLRLHGNSSPLTGTMRCGCTRTSVAISSPSPHRRRQHSKWASVGSLQSCRNASRRFSSASSTRSSTQSPPLC